MALAPTLMKGILAPAHLSLSRKASLTFSISAVSLVFNSLVLITFTRLVEITSKVSFKFECVGMPLGARRILLAR